MGENKDAAFDPNKPFTTRDGRPAHIERILYHGNVFGEPCAWSFSGRSGGEDEDFAGDLINVPTSPTETINAGETRAVAEALEAARNYFDLHYGAQDELSKRCKAAIAALARRTLTPPSTCTAAGGTDEYRRGLTHASKVTSEAVEALLTSEENKLGRYPTVSVTAAWIQRAINAEIEAAQAPAQGAVEIDLHASAALCVGQLCWNCKKSTVQKVFCDHCGNRLPWEKSAVPPALESTDNAAPPQSIVTGAGDNAGVMQDDLRQLLDLLGLPSGAQSRSPHAVFQEALAVLRRRIATLEAQLAEQAKAGTRATECLKLALACEDCDADKWEPEARAILAALDAKGDASHD